MIICSNCRSQQFDGTIFCLECGASLSFDQIQESTREIGASASPNPRNARQAMETDAHDGPTITFILAHNSHRITFQVTDELLIGRADQNKGIIPDIDLGPEGGYDAGVSRRHAILAHRRGAYTIEDLGSANGTFVNGRQLTPQIAVPLHHGDELKCGTLVLRVEI
jgi:pSer/pThr/pTyr-binding forkhead associated (FHA) protein